MQWSFNTKRFLHILMRLDVLRTMMQVLTLKNIYFSFILQKTSFSYFHYFPFLWKSLDISGKIFVPREYPPRYLSDDVSGLSYLTLSKNSMIFDTFIAIVEKVEI